ncbi:GRB10-interacting GYF protein 2 isoform X2 [Dendroctonus ponderosae]|uniref:GRB10-interacting GYF protein 2 isoform X2 n=1 Tax=Dendroctonus ponderosae TaxID=77166 RepID=UPI0020364F88|nr:GRB10-interacting GYF protein 2 isoform X2 [Dendroctonus ponderosae]
MLIAFSKTRNDIIRSMTDSMNFGPDWIRNLSSEGSTGGGTSGGSRYQLADFRYGREEMLALFDRNIKPPAYLVNFKRLYSETTLPPLALLPPTDEERGNWQGGRPSTLGGPPRGRGGSMERGGRPGRGRGGYQSYGNRSQYESGWGNGEPSDWSPRKDYPSRPVSMDNWRRARNHEEDDGWRMSTSGRGMNDKWGRQSSWRGEGEDERTGPPERGGRTGWQEVTRGGTTSRKSWDEDHLPEWVNEHPLESGGSFDDRGAFHGSDDEQEGRLGGPKRDGLQKSTSQQHISHKSHPPLLTSKSTMSLVKDIEVEPDNEDNGLHSNSESSSKEPPTGNKERKLSVPEAMDQAPKEIANNRDRAKSEGPQKSCDVQFKHQLEEKVKENEFEKLQEDFVSKLVVDEEPPKQNSQQQNNIDMSNLAPSQNLPVPGQDKWFYQDPQGQMQGPFTNIEMSEWFMAGYFGHDLKVRRQCDERFFLLGELIAMCNSNPFQTNVQFPVLKNDISKMPDHDLQFQYLPQIEAYKQAQARVLADPWSAIAVQQQELAAQRLIMQQQQVQQDIQYLQRQPPPSNPFMHMISQMQQANKLPPTGLMDKHPPNIPGGAINPHLHMHMSNFLSMQSRLPGGVPSQLTGGLPAGIPGQLGPNNMAANLSALPRANMVPAGMPLQGGLSSGMGLNVPTASAVEHNVNQNSDPITKLLKQLHQETQQQQHLVESLWQQNQFGVPNSNPTPQQWPGAAQPEMPLSMWDVQQPSQTSSPPEKSPADLTQMKENGELPIVEKEKPKKTDKAKENRQKDDEKELKKKKKAEEEQQKKEAEEKRKQEQRKIEIERKAEAEKKKKEEEKIKKELEKAKKEAEDKRLKELEEKRRLKEQRKLEEEAKKRTDEERRKLEEDRMQREKEQREREERQRVEERRQEQISMAKAAPWSQANSTFGMSLTEIQKAEKERKAQDAVLQAQKAQMERELQLQQQQQQLEKSGGIQLGWAKKAMEPRKVKSLAEIQAEEQERLIKEAAEARLKKEKETRDAVPIQQVNSIWSGQSLPWANSSSTQSQWSSATNISGFWDEPTQKPQPSKPSTVSKSSSMSTINSKQVQPAKQSQKSKSKKDDDAPANSKKNSNSNGRDDDFTTWCYKALSNIDTSVDIPTFVSFLRDIESAFEVREYCKEYLGEGNATQQFTNNFLEKRRSFKPKNAHKDDMCSPAPAITPSLHNTSEFQEVKGKNKKTKKSKMLKVDSRILGFNVTSASDRINVGDRDYGDNS